MKSSMCVCVLAAAVCGTLVSCADHRPTSQPSPISTTSYIDVQPGWRIRVVVPLLKSGGFKPALEEVHSEGGTVTLKTGKDFVGYETDTYSVQRTGDALEVEFRSGEVRRNDGAHIKNSRPSVPLFELPKDARYIRILFLTRSSDRDHDQAILASESLEWLNLLTTSVQSDPAQNCKAQLHGTCIWVSAGLAVRPEKKVARKWVPAL